MKFLHNEQPRQVSNHYFDNKLMQKDAILFIQICPMLITQLAANPIILIDTMMKQAFFLVLVLICSAQNAPYNEELAAKMIQLTASIYNITNADFQAIRCRDCYDEFTVLKMFIGSQILSMVGVDDELKSVIVVFRGSENAENWLTNLNAIKTKFTDDPTGCKECMVHKGFYEAYKSLLSQHLEDYVIEILKINPTYNVTVTGHSLGGAMASLTSAGLIARYPSLKVHLYTCGQPRVGTEQYSNYLNARLKASFRVVHRFDPVPHAPPLFALFFHAGHEIWYDITMLTDFLHCTGESNHCSNSIWKYEIKDHSVSFYNQLIKKFSRSYEVKYARPSQELIQKEKQAVQAAMKDYKPQKTSDLFDNRRSIPVSSTEL